MQLYINCSANESVSKKEIKPLKLKPKERALLRKTCGLRPNQNLFKSNGDTHKNTKSGSKQSLVPPFPCPSSNKNRKTKAKKMKFALTSMFLSLSLALSINLPTTANADSFKVRKTHGHWHLSCGTPPGAKSEKCALVQDVTDETRPNYSLRVIFLRSRDGKKEVLRVVAPLGVLLPTGLGLKIDNTDMGHAQFMKCGKIGCIAEVVVTNKIVQKFRTGKNAVFIIFQTPELGIGFPVSLNGFSAGYSTLK